MAKGGKKRTYVRDGSGRFASTPGGAAKKAAKSTSGGKGTLGARTGLKGSKAKLKAKDKADQTLQNTLSTRAQKGAVTRGSRKLAAAKVAAQTRIGGGRKGVIRKPGGLKSQGIAARSEAKPKPAPKIDMKQAINKATQLRNKAKQVSRQAESMMGGGRKDGAIVNMSMNSRARQSTVNKGITGSRLAAQAEALNNKAGRVLDRAIASRKKAEREALKPAKKQRSAESLRISRAKQVEKRRSINITNPAGWREDAAAKMAANAARTQKRALDFYKQKGRAPKTPVPAPNSPTRTKGSRISLPRTPGTIAKPKGLKPGALAARRMAKPGLSGGPQVNRRSQLLAGAQKRMTQADRIDDKIASLEKQYRSKDSAFYTQGVKTAERDRMHAKSRQAADLREQSAALRQKAANATKMAGKIKDKPKVKISSDKRVARAQINEANARSRPTTWKRRMAKSTAVRAQMFYANPMGFKHGNPFGKGWRVPRPFRGKL